MIEGGDAGENLFRYWGRRLGLLKNATPIKVEPTPKIETEAERLLRLKDNQLNDRKENSRTTGDAGAFGGTEIPAVVAEEGKPVVRKLAEQGKMPAKDYTGQKPPL